MANLKSKVSLYLKENSKSWSTEINNITLKDDLDGKGPYIHVWNVDGLDKPTDSKIASYETAANAAESEAIILNKRQKEYGTWREQMEMIYKDQKNGTTTFKDHCDKVRSDNPKG